MDPRPDHGETSYKGSGRLAGRKALITGGDSGMDRAAAIAYAREGADVAISYCPTEEPDAQEVIQLIKSDKAPAEELAVLYHERWEIETAFDELKTHLRGAKIVLRSKTPDLVRQEFYGLMMAHFAIRGLTHEAALKADQDPDRLSFLHAVRVVRHKLNLYGAIPLSAEENIS